MNDILNDKLSLEDHVRADRAKGLTYREIAKKRRLNFTQIKEVLDSKDEFVLNKIKKRIEILEKESERWEIRVSGYKELFNEYWEAKPLFDALNEIKRIGGPKTYVLETWWDWMKRSGISEHDIKMFIKIKNIDHLRAEERRLDIRVRELRAGRSLARTLS